MNRSIRIFGERDLVLRHSMIALARAGSFVIRYVLGSQMVERLMDVKSLWCLFRAKAVFNMDLRASPCFLTDMDTSNMPYLL